MGWDSKELKNAFLFWTYQICINFVCMYIEYVCVVYCLHHMTTKTDDGYLRYIRIVEYRCIPRLKWIRGGILSVFFVLCFTTLHDILAPIRAFFMC